MSWTTQGAIPSNIQNGSGHTSMGWSGQGMKLTAHIPRSIASTEYLGFVTTNFLIYHNYPNKNETTSHSYIIRNKPTKKGFNFVHQ
jgi:hypothetical protein